MPRVFFALWPDEDIRNQFFRVAQAAQPRSGGRLMRRENLHLTVVFVGKVADSELPALKAAAGPLDLPAFTLQFGRVRYWRHNRIVWAAPLVTPEPLGSLVKALEAGLAAAGIRYDQRDYQPHVTLIRDARPPGELTPLDFEWRVRDFTLIESAHDGRRVIYRVIARWPLTD
jgi:2'-5' RNA ligase